MQGQCNAHSLAKFLGAHLLVGREPAIMEMNGEWSKGGDWVTTVAKHLAFLLALLRHTPEFHAGAFIKFI